MSQILIDKIRKSRQRIVEIGALKFTVRRPTDMEISDMQRSKVQQSEILRRYVVGWAGITELDIIPGGTGVAVDFDTDLFMEWVADRPKLWAPLTEAITSLYVEHAKLLEDAEKKPESG